MFGLKLDWWVVWGLIAQALFTARFLVQWLASEKAKKSIIPNSFWLLSISGSGMLLAYAIIRADPVFILGQSFGSIVYLRNLRLIDLERNCPVNDGEHETQPTHASKRSRLLPVGLAVILLIAATASAIIVFYTPSKNQPKYTLQSIEEIDANNGAITTEKGYIQIYLPTGQHQQQNGSIEVISPYPLLKPAESANRLNLLFDPQTRQKAKRYRLARQK